MNNIRFRIYYRKPKQVKYTQLENIDENYTDYIYNQNPTETLIGYLSDWQFEGTLKPGEYYAEYEYDKERIISKSRVIIIK